ncbi:hypothetical protein [Jannaschia marina]|uniref:hypothetical protein n=1 Tax=Jannaschia marina TaxID=2741674 RepID=UPI0015CA573A|nr:hypothetical protein [Jannaschia marina]
MAQPHDIEDVLSSIRRLVANEAGPAAAAKAADTAKTEGPTLVLDDSHRVTEPEDPFQMIRSLAQDERDGRDAEHVTTALPEEIAAITTDLRDTSAPAEVWDSGDLAPDVPLPVEAEEVPAHGEADMSATAEDVTAPFPASDYAEDTDFEVAEASEGHDAPAAPVSDMPATEAGVADLSATVGDDEALRDLIAEIVRQELAGELGERITRNVRKLVRREIRQMLASEDFD